MVREMDLLYPVSQIRKMEKVVMRKPGRSFDGNWRMLASHPQFFPSINNSSSVGSIKRSVESRRIQSQIIHRQLLLIILVQRKQQRTQVRDWFMSASINLER